ncbi:hypothetical protein Aab01nite_29010 [Paractinoplanes abujensis]|uniref:Uncharacterized protein n=1 Tax=Paractinoplanes abujensis TaxID=882441 RepID=A0A7W7D0V1_9ACTN|nr:hypothetical protein [Actinoplanes abujensis]MBB4698203.1 hypothetical protein [Actinoplanes abujensis]GID19311.1 hypothetical protein Aab01nite_29010 [Actinoplanes abujensis]
MTGDGLGRGLSDMWRSVLLFLPTALAFAAILLVGYLIARLLRTAATRALHRAGLDRVVERGAAAPLFTRVSASELTGKLLFYGVLLFALQVAFGLWGPNPVSDLLTDVIAWLPRLLVAIVLIVVAATVARAAEDLIGGALGSLPYGRLLARAASVVIVALGVIAALDQVRIATTITQPVLIAVLATLAGVVIVGVGGGLIRPMQQRWDTWLDRAATESAVIREHARTNAPAAAGVRAEPSGERDESFEPDETQVIPRQGEKQETQATVITAAAGDSMIINPGPNDTIVIGSGTEDTESTQVIPPADTTTTRPLPRDDEDAPGK